MNTATKKFEDDLTSEQLLAIKGAEISETLDNIKSLLNKEIAGSGKEDRALELVHKYQGKIEELETEIERILEFELSEGRL